MTILRSLLVLLTVAVGFSARAQDYWGFRKETLTVKVTSSFKRNPDLKLEGSGVIFRDGGTLYVLTSEHVVLPSNEEAVHHVENHENDFSADAVFVKAEWSKGLALLRLVNPKIGNHWLDAYPPSSEMAPAYYVADPREGDAVVAYGFPAGTDQMNRSEGKFEGRRKEGEVLATQTVFAASGLTAEFGMSGGPVFAGDRLLGIMTHVTFDDERITYIIPAWYAFEWVRVGGGSGLVRDIKDFQTQFFSKEKSEAVHRTGWPMKIEKRGGKILVTVEPGGTEMDMSGTVQRGYMNLNPAMQRAHVHIGEMTSVNGLRVTPRMTLQQFVGELLQASEPPGFVDYEQTAAQGTPNYVYAPNFVPKNGQTASYDVTATREVLEKRWDPSHTKMWWEYVDKVQRGTVHYIVGIEDEGIFNKQSFFPGDVPHYDQGHARDGLNSTEHWRTLLANCTRRGGTIEKLAVPAGTFQTCRMREKDLTIWYGPVPILGIVKLLSDDGNDQWILTRVAY